MKKLLLLIFFLSFVWAEKPELLLLKEYKNQDVSGWLMSEKLDGVRAYWDGKKLISRGGNEFHAPAWFTQHFPPFELDGELWSKQGDFDTIVSIVKKKAPHDGWRALTYNIFEVPHAKGGLMQRLAILEEYLKYHHTSYIHIIPQQICEENKTLKSFLEEVEKVGGEGVVVRNPITPYVDKRDKNSLKVKRFYDAECEVLRHNQGQGKYQTMMGSLTCKTQDGVVFDVGSGFSDAMRCNPPVIGTLLTYQYNEITKNGKPRFPTFLRIKETL